MHRHDFPGTMATGDATELSPKKKRRLQEMQLLRKLSTPGTIQQIYDGDGSTLNNTLKEHIEEELASYMGLTLINEQIFDFDLLGFWKRSESYTILSKLARVIHCIPASSVEIERVWSRAGLIMTDRRSRMNNWNFKVNLFCSKNFSVMKSLHGSSESSEMCL